MLKGKKCYYAFFILLFLGFLSILIFTVFELIEKEPKCYNPMIWEGEVSETDELQFGNHIFSTEEYEKINETHVSVCLENKIPILRKCCGKGQKFNLATKPPCVNDDDDFENLLTVHDEDNNFIEKFNLSNFDRRYGMISCPNGKYMLNPKYVDDFFILRQDGTIFRRGNDTNNTQNSDKFCLDVIVEGTEEYLGALVCFPKQNPERQLKIYPYGMIISTPFLLATFLFHALTQELRTLNGLFIMCHSASLIFFYIFLAITQIDGKSLPITFCKICGFIVQFTFLAAFFWLNIMCANMWWSIRNFRQIERGTSIKQDLKKFLLCCCYGWGGPGIISCISLVMDLYSDVSKDYKPNIGTTMCTLDIEENKYTALFYLYGPMGIIMICNLYFFISTAAKISLTKKTIHMLNSQDSRCSREESRKSFTIYLKLFIVMGITWLMELLSWAIGGPKYIWYIPDFSNSLQGLYIFMIFLPKAKKILTKKFSQRNSQRNSDSTKSSSTGKSSKNSCPTPLDTSKTNGDVKIRLVPISNNVEGVVSPLNPHPDLVLQGLKNLNGMKQSKV